MNNDINMAMVPSDQIDEQTSKTLAKLAAETLLGFDPSEGTCVRCGAKPELLEDLVYAGQKQGKHHLMCRGCYEHVMCIRTVMPVPNSRCHLMIEEEGDGVSITVFNHYPNPCESKDEGDGQIYIEQHNTGIYAYVFGGMAAMRGDIEGIKMPLASIIPPKDVNCQ